MTSTTQPTPTTAGVTEAQIDAYKAAYDAVWRDFRVHRDPCREATRQGLSAALALSSAPAGEFAGWTNPAPDASPDRSPNTSVTMLVGGSTAPAGDGVPGMVLVPKGWKPTHKHVKRGSEYRLDGYGEIQTDTPLTDYAKVAIYSAADGSVWVRPVTEFEDGRFVALSASTAGGGK